MLITIKELLEEIANPKPEIIDKEKYAFPTNGVQRKTCSDCVFFGGKFDPELILTVCNFRENAPLDKKTMRPYSYYEEGINPKLKAKRLERCPCYINKKTIIEKCRKYILNELREKYGEED